MIMIIIGLIIIAYIVSIFAILAFASANAPPNATAPMNIFGQRKQTFMHKF